MSSVATESVFSVPLNHFRCSDVASLGCAEESAEQLNLPTGLNRFVGDEPNQLLKVFNLTQSSEIPVGSTPFNWSTGLTWPLVLFGPSGTGKTSLGLSFLANLSQSKFGQSNVHASDQPKQSSRSSNLQPGYITASDFDRRFRASIETDSVIEFRSKLTNRAGLLIDNLTELATKPVAQQEIVHLIDTMVAKNRPILFTMGQSPYGETQLIPQLVSRLGSGLALPVSPPGSQARQEIIRELANLHQLRFTNDALLVLVERMPFPVPGINHLLIQFKLSLSEAEKSLHASDDSLIDSDRIVQWLCAGSSSINDTEKLIRKAVAKEFNVKVADLSSQSRKQTTVLARGVAIWLNRQLIRTSFKKIGQQFGNRDHSTIMHAWQKIDSLMSSDHANNDNDRSIQLKIEKLKQKLTLQMTTLLPVDGKPVQKMSTNVGNKTVANNSK